MVMKSQVQPITQLAEMQPVFQLPALPPLIGIQSAYADQSTTFNDNYVDACQESGAGVNNANCDAIVNDGISVATQTDDNALNLYDVIVNADGLNDCDEFDAGNNNVDCINDIDHIVGPVTQTNNPPDNPSLANEIDIVTDDNMLNDCNESGSGNNNAACTNIGNDVISEMTQDNFVDATTIDAGFAETNTINTLQGFDETNDCDDAGGGDNSGLCENEVDNFIGVIDQINSVSGTTPNTIHSNNIEVSQLGTATNNCDESGAGTGINDAQCTSEVDNDVDSVTQDNNALGADNTAQTNDFSVIQSSDFNNACNEFEDGNNLVFCDMDDSDNDIIAVDQLNSAFGSAGATISQNNEIDGDDALGIPGITQVLIGDNTCGQTGSGNNEASCEFDGTDNFIEPIEQGNVVSNAGDQAVISQDNRGVFSQVNAGENDCDENTFTDVHDNNADCILRSFLNNFLGPIEQDNHVIGAFDNSISDQDNNVAVSQDILTENDCNGTGGNNVECINDGFNNGIDFIDFNFIANIEQFNEANLDGDVSSVQLNDVVIDQSGALSNTCDETGGGVNNALCDNTEAMNYVGPVRQSNVVDAPNSNSAVQLNGAQIAQNMVQQTTVMKKELELVLHDVGIFQVTLFSL